MTALKPQLQRLAERINALGLRERVLIFITAALVLVTLLYSVLITPLLKHQQQVSQQITETQNKINALHVQIQAHTLAGRTDPNAPLRARLEQFKADAAHLNQDLYGIQNGLITPQQMPLLLKEILRSNRSLRLISMKTLPTQIIGAGTDMTRTTNNVDNNPAPEVGAYKHGFEITLQGQYLDMLGYLSAIEASPWRIFWGGADLNVDTYPKTVLTLKLYTLSMDQAWLTL